MRTRPARSTLLGIATGIFVLLGLVIGGVALANNGGGSGVQSPTVRVGDESSEGPGATPSVKAPATTDKQGDDADEDDRNEQGGRTATACPSPTKTMSHDESDHHGGDCDIDDESHTGGGDD